MADILKELADILEQRKQANADSSYVAQLYSGGINKILEKVGEESTETLLAAKDFSASPTEENKLALVRETADLWFHTLVMLTKLDMSHDDVLNELGSRFGVSGLEEKAARQQ